MVHATVRVIGTAMGAARSLWWPALQCSAQRLGEAASVTHIAPSQSGPMASRTTAAALPALATSAAVVEAAVEQA
jgi:hypothetical protein